MPFAGHPTLGSAHVVRDRSAAGDNVVLEMQVGLVDVRAIGDSWTLRAAEAPQTRRPDASRSELARMVGLTEQAFDAEPLWVDTGAEQLVLPLRSVDDVAPARPDAALLRAHGFSERRGASMAYVWARRDPSTIVARFYFLSGGASSKTPPRALRAPTWAATFW